MDCIFNCFIPKPTKDLMVIRPASKTFINGMTESFSDAYKTEILQPYMKEQEFNKIIDKINAANFDDYPCPGCLMFGYCCCPCTLGLSFLLPLRKVKKAQHKVENMIEMINAQYQQRKIMFKLKVENSTSYILMYLPNNPIWEQSEYQLQQ